MFELRWSSLPPIRFPVAHAAQRTYCVAEDKEFFFFSPKIFEVFCLCMSVPSTGIGVTAVGVGAGNWTPSVGEH